MDRNIRNGIRIIYMSLEVQDLLFLSGFTLSMTSLFIYHLFPTNLLYLSTYIPRQSKFSMACSITLLTLHLLIKFVEVLLLSKEQFYNYINSQSYNNIFKGFQHILKNNRNSRSFITIFRKDFNLHIPAMFLPSTNKTSINKLIIK